MPCAMRVPKLAAGRYLTTGDTDGWTLRAERVMGLPAVAVVFQIPLTAVGFGATQRLGS